MTPDDIAKRLLQFAVRISRVVDSLPDTRVGRLVAGQLIRCGTSPMPNYQEACGGESHNDFIHKLRICLKELRESRAWLEFILKAELLPKKRLGDLVEESDQLCRIFGQSVVTTSAGGTRRRRHPGSLETQEFEIRN